jgi:hypothetical protein
VDLQGLITIGLCYAEVVRTPTRGPCATPNVTSIEKREKGRQRLARAGRRRDQDEAVKKARREIYNTRSIFETFRCNIATYI